MPTPRSCTDSCSGRSSTNMTIIILQCLYNTYICILYSPTISSCGGAGNGQKDPVSEWKSRGRHRCTKRDAAPRLSLMKNIGTSFTGCSCCRRRRSARSYRTRTRIVISIRKHNIISDIMYSSVPTSAKQQRRWRVREPTKINPIYVGRFEFFVNFIIFLQKTIYNILHKV